MSLWSWAVSECGVVVMLCVVLGVSCDECMLCVADCGACALGYSLDRLA